MKTLYQILGVKPEATTEQIRAAFRKLSKKHHPDAGGSQQKFQELTRAHSILIDPEKRSIYDQTGDIDASDKSVNIDGMLANLWLMLVNSDAFDQGNPVEIIKRHIKDTRDKLNQDKQRSLKCVAKWRKIAPSITCKGEFNLLQETLLNRAKEVELEAKQIDIALATQTLLEARVAEFSLKEDGNCQNVASLMDALLINRGANIFYKW